MTVTRSPGYPSLPLKEAIELASKLYSEVRTSVTDREAAAKDLGYSGLTGASAKALADLMHYGLLERVGKGGIRVSERTVNILWGEPDAKIEGIKDAALSPDLFLALDGQFPDLVPSENQLKGYLHRRGFIDVAIPLVVKSYTETRRFVQEIAASESHGASEDHGAESATLNMPKADVMSDTTILERPRTIPSGVAPAMPTPSGSAKALQLNRIDMNIQGDKVLLSGLLDMKGLDALEKKIAALRVLLEVYHEACDTGEDEHDEQT